MADQRDLLYYQGNDPRLRVAARVKRITAVFPEMAQDPQALLSFAQAPIDDDKKMLDAVGYTLAGQRFSDTRRRLDEMSTSGQRDAFAKMDPLKQWWLEQSGYKVPQKPGVFHDLIPGSGLVRKAVGVVSAPLAVPVRVADRALGRVGSKAMNAQMAPVNGLTRTSSRVLQMASGQAELPGVFGDVYETVGGITRPVSAATNPLSWIRGFAHIDDSPGRAMEAFLGTDMAISSGGSQHEAAMERATFDAAAAAQEAVNGKKITQAEADRLFNDPEALLRWYKDWDDPIRPKDMQSYRQAGIWGLDEAWSTTGRTQIYLRPSAEIKALDQIGNNSAALELAKKMAGGKKIVDVLADAGITPNDPSYYQRAQALDQLTLIDGFDKAVKTLGGARTSFGDTIAVLTMGDAQRSSGTFRLTAGVTDVVFQFAADPTLRAGAIAKAFRAGRHGIEAEQAVEHLRTLAEHARGEWAPAADGMFGKAHAANVNARFEANHRAARFLYNAVTSNSDVAIGNTMRQAPQFAPAIPYLIEANRIQPFRDFASVYDALATEAGMATMLSGRTQKTWEVAQTAVPYLTRGEQAKMVGSAAGRRLIDWGTNLRAVQPGETRSLADRAVRSVVSGPFVSVKMAGKTVKAPFINVNDAFSVRALLDSAPVLGIDTSEQWATLGKWALAENEGARVNIIKEWMHRQINQIGVRQPALEAIDAKIKQAIVDEKAFDTVLSPWERDLHAMTERVFNQRYSITGADIVVAPDGTARAMALLPVIDSADHLQIFTYRELARVADSNMWLARTYRALNPKFVDRAMANWKAANLTRFAFGLRNGAEEALSTIIRVGWGHYGAGVAGSIGGRQAAADVFMSEADHVTRISDTIRAAQQAKLAGQTDTFTELMAKADELSQMPSRARHIGRLVEESRQLAMSGDAKASAKVLERAMKIRDGLAYKPITGLAGVLQFGGEKIAHLPQSGRALTGVETFRVKATALAASIVAPTRRIVGYSIDPEFVDAAANLYGLNPEVAASWADHLAGSHARANFVGNGSTFGDAEVVMGTVLRNSNNAGFAGAMVPVNGLSQFVEYPTAVDNGHVVWATRAERDAESEVFKAAARSLSRDVSAKTASEILTRAEKSPFNVPWDTVVGTDEEGADVYATVSERLARVKRSVKKSIDDAEEGLGQLHAELHGDNREQVIEQIYQERLKVRQAKRKTKLPAAKAQEILEQVRADVAAMTEMVDAAVAKGGVDKLVHDLASLDQSDALRSVVSEAQLSRLGGDLPGASEAAARARKIDPTKAAQAKSTLGTFTDSLDYYGRLFNINTDFSGAFRLLDGLSPRARAVLLNDTDWFMVGRPLESIRQSVSDAMLTRLGNEDIAARISDMGRLAGVVVPPKPGYVPAYWPLIPAADAPLVQEVARRALAPESTFLEDAVGSWRAKRLKNWLAGTLDTTGADAIAKMSLDASPGHIVMADVALDGYNPALDMMDDLYRSIGRLGDEWIAEGWKAPATGTHRISMVDVKAPRGYQFTPRMEEGQRIAPLFQPEEEARMVAGGQAAGSDMYVLNPAVVGRPQVLEDWAMAPVTMPDGTVMMRHGTSRERALRDWADRLADHHVGMYMSRRDMATSGIVRGVRGDAAGEVVARAGRYTDEGTETLHEALYALDRGEHLVAVASQIKDLPMTAVGNLGDILPPKDGLFRELVNKGFETFIDPVIDAMSRHPAFIASYGEALKASRGMTQSLLRNSPEMQKAAAIAAEWGVSMDDIWEAWMSIPDAQRTIRTNPTVLRDALEDTLRAKFDALEDRERSVRRVTQYIADNGDVPGVKAKLSAFPVGSPRPNLEPKEFVEWQIGDPIPALYHGTAGNWGAGGKVTKLDGGSGASNLVGDGMYSTDNGWMIAPSYAGIDVNPDVSTAVMDQIRDEIFRRAQDEAKYYQKGYPNIRFPGLYKVRYAGSPKVLKLDSPVSDEILKVWEEMAPRYTAEVIAEKRGRREAVTGLDLWEDSWPRRTINGGEVDITAINRRMGDMGYDALHHIGGGRMGDTRHNVFVWLEDSKPQHVLGHKEVYAESILTHGEYNVSVGLSKGLLGLAKETKHWPEGRTVALDELTELTNKVVALEAPKVNPADVNQFAKQMANEFGNNTAYVLTEGPWQFEVPIVRPVIKDGKVERWTWDMPPDTVHSAVRTALEGNYDLDPLVYRIIDGAILYDGNYPMREKMWNAFSQPYYLSKEVDASLTPAKFDDDLERLMRISRPDANGVGAWGDVQVRWDVDADGTIQGFHVQVPSDLEIGIKPELIFRPSVRYGYHESLYKAFADTFDVDQVNNLMIRSPRVRITGVDSPKIVSVNDPRARVAAANASGKNLASGALGNPDDTLLTEGLTAFRDAMATRTHVEKVMSNAAIEGALNRVTPFIDDNRIRSFWSDMLRNVFPFSYAEEAFVRRWARTAANSPDSLHRLQMYANALDTVGFTHRDDQGNQVYTVPVLPAVFDLIAHTPVVGTVLFGQTPQLPGKFAPMVPMARLDRTLPGVSDPARVSVSPFVSVAAKAVRNLFRMPVLSEGVGGPVKSQDDSILRSLMPRWVSTYWDARFGDPNELDAELNRITIGAAASFAAEANRLRGEADVAEVKAKRVGGVEADRLRAEAKKMREDADLLLPTEGQGPQQFEAWQTNVVAYARKMLATRALLQFSAPTAGAVTVRGDMSPKFWDILAKSDSYQEALTRFHVLHPDDLPFTIPGSQSVAGGPSNFSKAAGEWIDANPELAKNALAAPWLLPPASGYDQVTYMRELALGWRKAKTLEDWVGDMYFAAAATEYFDTRRERDRLLEQFKDRPDVKAQINQRWHDFDQTYKEQHPVFKKQYGSRDAQTRRDNVRTQILEVGAQRMIPSDPHSQAVYTLTVSFKQYLNARDSFWGRRDRANMDARDRLDAQWVEYARDFMERNPTVAGYYNGVIVPDDPSGES